MPRPVIWCPLHYFIHEVRWSDRVAAGYNFDISRGCNKRHQETLKGSELHQKCLPELKGCTVVQFDVIINGMTVFCCMLIFFLWKHTSKSVETTSHPGSIWAEIRVCKQGLLFAIFMCVLRHSLTPAVSVANYACCFVSTRLVFSGLLC